MMNFACLRDDDLADQLVGVLADERFSKDNSLVALLSVCAERIRNKTKFPVVTAMDAQIASAVFERISKAAREATYEAEQVRKKLDEIDKIRPHVEILIDAPKPGRRSPCPNTRKIAPCRVKGGIR